MQRLKDEGHAPTYWLPPSFKSHYRNNRFNFTKPLLVIQNKFNIEPAKRKAIYGNAKKSPVIYLPLWLLGKLFEKYQNKYQIIYNRCEIELGRNDIEELGDFDLIRNRYPEILLVQDLAEKEQLNYNETQLLIYAQCERFLGVQGGGACMLHYFGGTSLIFHRMPDNLYEDVLKGIRKYGGTIEITRDTNYYEMIYPKLSGQRIFYERDIESYAEKALTLY